MTEPAPGKLGETRAELLAVMRDRARELEYGAGAEMWLALADYLEATDAELIGRLEHADDNAHRLLAGVGSLLAELERFRPLLNLISRNGSAPPDFISIGQAVRARRAARPLKAGSKADQRARDQRE